MIIKINIVCIFNFIFNLRRKYIYIRIIRVNCCCVTLPFVLRWYNWARLNFWTKLSIQYWEVYVVCHLLPVLKYSVKVRRRLEALWLAKTMCQLIEYFRGEGVKTEPQLCRVGLSYRLVLFLWVLLFSVYCSIFDVAVFRSRSHIYYFYWNQICANELIIEWVLFGKLSFLFQSIIRSIRHDVNFKIHLPINLWSPTGLWRLWPRDLVRI